MHFGFVDEGKLYFYMPAIDPDFRRERVGAVLLYAMVQHYGKSVAVFDFMRGLQPYKLWYTDELEINMRIVVCWSASLPAALYNASEVARRFVIDLGLPKAAVQFVQRGAGRLRAMFETLDGGRRAVPERQTSLRSLSTTRRPAWAIAFGRPRSTAKRRAVSLRL